MDSHGAFLREWMVRSHLYLTINNNMNDHVTSIAYMLEIRCFSILLLLGLVPDPGPVLFLGSVDHLAASGEGERGSQQMFPGIVAKRKLLSGSWHTLRNVGVR